MFLAMAFLALPATAESAPLYELPELPPVSAPVPVLAEGPSKISWTFAEVNYKWVDVDALDDSIDGVELKGSLEILLNIFLQASYSMLSGDVDVDETRIGAGWHFGVGDTLDLFGILSYAYEDPDGGDSEDGVRGEAGARFLLGEKIELNGEAIWQNIDESDYGIGVGGRFYLTPKISLGLGAEILDNDETYTAGARFQF